MHEIPTGRSSAFEQTPQAGSAILSPTQMFLILLCAACAGGRIGDAICHSVATGVCVRVPPAISGDEVDRGDASIAKKNSGRSMTTISTAGVF